MSGFLYPFLEGEPPDLDALRADLVASARSKTVESVTLQLTTLEHAEAQLGIVAGAMADRFGDGGRLFTFGNGGSSTDAMSVAALFASPPWGVALPAQALVTDPAVLTAISNDVGFELAFSRQLIAYSKPTDIVIGLSTSGNSRNLLCAFGEARRLGNLTIGFAGYDGGDISRSGEVDHTFVVDSASVHRIQETQGALSFALWAAVQQRLGAVGGDDD
jgi:D-sedoheptulose 7-phosphate isomerase